MYMRVCVCMYMYVCTSVYVLADTCFITSSKDGQERSMKSYAVGQQSSPWMGMVLALEQNSKEIVMDVSRLNGRLVP